ncbi:hypothetical protein DWB63_11000 [Pseudodesulfovibrio sp. S3]|nr:hypothetical protein DWB63_11000 [Pseudodesulfovibrio sp. S3]
MYGNNNNGPILSSAEITFLLSDQTSLKAPANNLWPDTPDHTVETTEEKDIFFSFYTSPDSPKTSNA